MKYVVKNGKELKCGFTTGSCATAASACAFSMLLTGKKMVESVIKLPSGEKAILKLSSSEFTDEKTAVCSVTKDGGDDPDATTGLDIFAEVTLTDEPNLVEIDGGKGVGRVSVKGLQIKVGEAAINPVPRKMIDENIRMLANRFNYTGGAKITIFVPGGEEVAKKTYNERIGIKGGISILGTTGIVEPMSEKALVDTIKIMVDRQHILNDKDILISPGNYGKEFCKEHLNLDIDRAVQISNYIGEALDYIKYKGFDNILLVGHTGKILKIAAGIMNTHSSYADGRMEIIAAHSALYGAGPEIISEILKCVTTDEAFDILAEKPYYEDVKKSIMDKVMYHLNYRLKGECHIEAIMFTTDRRHVILSEGAKDFTDKFMEDIK